MSALRVQLSSVSLSNAQVVLLQGAGSHFCTGGAQHQDAGLLLVPLQLAPTTSTLADMVECVMMLTQTALPILAVLHGRLIGGGMALALNTDWCSCTVGATLNQGNLPRNMSPIMQFSQTLGQCAGTTTTQALHLEDATIGALQAHQLGIVQTIDVDAINAQTCARSVRKEIARKGQPMLLQPGKIRDDSLQAAESMMNTLALLDNTRVISRIAETTPGPTTTTSSTAFISAVGALGSSDTARVIKAMVLSKVNQVVSCAAVQAEDPLMESGLDSLAATELHTLLQHEMGSALKLPSTITFDYPTSTSISSYLFNALEPMSAARPAAPSICLPTQETNPSNLKAVHSTWSFTALAWNLQWSAADTTSQIPRQRFDATTLEKQGMYCMHGHFCSGVEMFDNTHFRIGPAEAANMDPHQRHLLETGYSALVAAGARRQLLLGSNIGIFLGMASDGEWSGIASVTSAYSVLSVGAAMACGRISYVLGLQGPCISVNTACSSSLVALDSACVNLDLTRCTESLVLGANLYFNGATWVAACAMRALAPDGLCKTFDASADGFGRGEAIVAMMIQDGDSGSGLTLKHTAVNQDGRSASMSAPHGPSQVRVIQNALHSMPSHTQHFSETHGTGTALGDPIEVGALKVVFGPTSNDAGLPLVLGALKSRLGHTEGAAGVIGVIKAAKVLELCCVPLNLHLSKPNGKLDLEGLAVVMVSGMVCARAESAAGVSSFGMSGTNAHAVLAIRGQDQSIMTNQPQRVVQYQPTAFTWSNASSTTATSNAIVPLLGVSTVALEEGTEMLWEHSWPTATCNYMAHHRVGQTPVAPGTGYLCMVREAVTMEETDPAEIIVSEAQFTAMLFLDSRAPSVRVAVQHPAQGDQRSVRIESSGGLGEWVQHALVVVATGEVSSMLVDDSAAEWNRHRLWIQQSSLQPELDGLVFYASTGNNYRHEFRSVAALWVLSETEHHDALVIAKVTFQDLTPSQVDSLTELLCFD